MKESFAFNIAKQDGAFPLAAQDHAVDAKKRRVQMFAEDMSRVLKGEKGKHKWQLVDKAGKPTDFSSAIAALDQVSGRRASASLNQNKRKQKQQQPVTPLARQQQSQTDKAGLIDRLYGGKGSLESKLWPDA